MLRRLVPAQRPQALLALQRTVGNAAVQRRVRQVEQGRPHNSLTQSGPDGGSASLWQSVPRRDGRAVPPTMLFRLVIERDDTDDDPASDPGVGAAPTGPAAMTAQMTGL